jgi:hypothetical protein
MNISQHKPRRHTHHELMHNPPPPQRPPLQSPKYLHFDPIPGCEHNPTCTCTSAAVGLATGKTGLQWLCRRNQCLNRDAACAEDREISKFG